MRCAERVDGLKTHVAADAVFDMGDEIARCQTGSFREEILRPARTGCRTHHAVAENVLLADDREFRRFKTFFEAEQRDADCRLVHSGCIGPVGDRANGGKSVVRQDAAEALRRSDAPGCDDDALFCRLKRVNMIGGRLEDVDFAGRALRLKIAADLAAGIDRLHRLRRLER